jgi:hypothetical protein
MGRVDVWWEVTLRPPHRSVCRPAGTVRVNAPGLFAVLIVDVGAAVGFDQRELVQCEPATDTGQTTQTPKPLERSEL